VKPLFEQTVIRKGLWMENEESLRKPKLRAATFHIIFKKSKMG
jgi:hypothetical protein